MVKTYLATSTLFGVDNAKVGTRGLIDTPSSLNNEYSMTISFHIEGKVTCFMHLGRGILVAILLGFYRGGSCMREDT